MTDRTELKHCPFCGSKVEAGGTSFGNVTVRYARCSKSDCIASFRSVDWEIWNARAAPASLDDPEFWLLVRRFSTAPAGEKRDAAKAAVLSFVGSKA